MPARRVTREARADDAARILHVAFERAETSLTTPIVNNQEIIQRIELVTRSDRNRACIRFLLACTLAKSVYPSVDIRKPYTEIGTPDAYSGRTYDEQFVILDCIGFIRHFLHLFHRIRIEFLDAYQELLLAEPDSAVRPELKVAFLALRRTYESAYSSDETTGAVYNLELPLIE